jgi:hypothetical protein
MPRHSSDEIFYLVKSLSASELVKLRENLASSPNSPLAKGESPLYLKLVEHIYALERYDDKEVKSHFGYHEVNSGSWRVLKKKAIEQVIKAIELANENQNDYAKLHRLPAVLRHLVNRGIYQQAETIGKKYLEIAIKEQQFHLVSELVDILHLLTVSYHSPSHALEKIKHLQQKRRSAKQRQSNLEEFQEIWYELSIEARKPTYPTKEFVKEILSMPIVKEREYKSTNAEMYYWKIISRSCFLMRDYNGYVKALDNGIAFSEKAIDNGKDEIFDFYINRLKDRGQIELLAHRFTNASEYENRMHDLLKRKNLSGKADARIRAILFRFQLSMHYKSGNWAELKTSLGAAASWFLVTREMIDKHENERLSRMIATYSFFIGDYANAAKWIYPLRGKVLSNNNVFAWIFYLIARLENGDLDVILKELKATKKQVSRSDQDATLYLKLIAYIENSAKESTENPAGGKNLADDIRVHPDYDKLSNFFPFSLWLHCRLGGLSLWNETQKRSSPLEEF